MSSMYKYFDGTMLKLFDKSKYALSLRGNNYSTTTIKTIS